MKLRIGAYGSSVEGLYRPGHFIGAHMQLRDKWLIRSCHLERRRLYRQDMPGCPAHWVFTTGSVTNNDASAHAIPASLPKTIPFLSSSLAAGSRAVKSEVGASK